VTFNRKQRIIAIHPGSVIRNSNQLHTAAHHLDIDLRRAGIERIFHQLLHYRSRPLNHLSRRNFINYVVREHLDGFIHKRH